MGDHLRIDMGRIAQAASDLGVLVDRFANAPHYLDGYREDLGHRHLADTVDDFSGDWKIHREQRTKRLQKLADGSQNAVDAYTAVDRDLANALQQSSGT